MAVPKTDYPLAAPVETEAMQRVQFEWTKDGLMCQIHVLTSRGRTVTLNGGMLGEVEFKALWDGTVLGAVALQDIWDAVPELTPEERGVAVAAPVEE